VPREQDWLSGARSDAAHYFIGFDSQRSSAARSNIYLFVCSLLKTYRSILNIGVSPVAVTSSLRVDKRRPVSE